MRLYYVTRTCNVVPYILSFSHSEKTHSSINSDAFIDSVNQLTRWEEECAALEGMKKSAVYQCYQSHVLK